MDLRSLVSLVMCFAVSVVMMCREVPAAPAKHPAKDAAFTFLRGVNISHWLAQFKSRSYAGDWFNEEDVSWIAAQGFDHIRCPVDGRVWLMPDGRLDESKMVPFDQALRWTREAGLGIILDMHFLPGASFQPGSEETAVYTDMALQKKVADFWRRVAQRYAGEGDHLRFEILNEPVAKLNKQLNPFNRAMLAAIRESNPMRKVYITSNRWSTFDNVVDLDIPADPNVALTLHNYEPFIFTHQQAPWVRMPRTMPLVPFPGTVPDLKGEIPRNTELEKNSGLSLTVEDLEARFSAVAAWAAENAPGIEIHVGEFGAYEAADMDSRRRWTRAIVEACESRGWGWAIWDYQGGFAVRDREGNPTPVLAELFKK